MRLWRKIFRIRDIHQVIIQSRTETGLKKNLSVLDLTFMGIGCIIGTGIFVLSGHAAAKHAGPAVCISFLIGALVAAASALCYAEMVSIIPVAGSAYSYVYTALGELLAFLLGWDLILEYMLGAATVAIGWSSYFVGVMQKHLHIPLIDRWVQSPYDFDVYTEKLVSSTGMMNLPAFVIVLIVTVVLVVGVDVSAKFNNIAVLIKIGIILLFIAFGLPFIQLENLVPLVPENTGIPGQFGLSGIFQGARMVFFSYIGFDAICTAAQETKNPQRNLPIAILLSLLVAGFLYFMVSITLVGLVPYHELNIPDPIRLGVEKTGKHWLAVGIEVGALLGLASVLLELLMAQPRIFYAMARDRLFFSFAEKIHHRFKTPYMSTILCGVICSLSAAFLPMELLSQMSSMGTLLAFALVALSVIVLRYRYPELPRAFRVPGPLWGLPALSFFSSLWLMSYGQNITFVGLLLWSGVGLIFYFAYGLYRFLTTSSIS